MSTSITSCVGDVTLDPKRHVSLGGGNPIVYLWVSQRGQLPGQQSGWLLLCSRHGNQLQNSNQHNNQLPKEEIGLLGILDYKIQSSKKIFLDFWIFFWFE